MDVIRVSDLLQPYRDRIEPALDAACAFGAGCPEPLGDAIRYSVLAPGKRLRPSIVLMAAEACGGAVESVLPAAVAVEMIHAYSLIHDDLPAMDDDDLRRGRPTTHVVFGQASAILAGDALQSEAYAHLYRGISDPLLAARLIGELATAAGTEGLVGGQEDDLAAERLSISDFDSPGAALAHLESIHRRKTGALFIACARMGAIAAGGSEEQVASLGRFADTFGLAFQITDDILDLTASAEELGKRTGKDRERGKFTFPDLMAAQPGPDSELASGDSSASASCIACTGVERARERASALIHEAHQSLELFGASAHGLRQMADYLLERTS